MWVLGIVEWRERWAGDIGVPQGAMVLSWRIYP